MFAINIHKILCIIMAILLAALFTSCSDKVENKEIEYVIGVSQANMREPWRIHLMEELKDEARKYPNIKLIFMDATQDSNKQIEDINKLKEYGADLLIVSPCDVESLTPTISDIYTDIPVIVLDRIVTGYDYTLFIGPDNKLIGEKAGEVIIDEEKSSINEECGEKIHILELKDGARPQASEERHNGLELIISNYNNIEANEIVINGELRDNTEDYIMGLQASQLDNTDIIFAHSDYIALGAYRALKKLNRENIKIIGIDGFLGQDGGIEMVQNGQIDATITCPTGGREAISYAMNILRRESGVPKQVILKSHTITNDTVNDYINKLKKANQLYSKKIRVGHVQVGTESAFRRANHESIIDAAAEFNIDLTIIDGNQSREEQIEAIREFIKQRMDVIVLSPVISTGWDEVLEEANDAGIPILLSDRNISVDDENLYTTFIGADFIEEGRRAMRWVVDNVPVNKGVLNDNCLPNNIMEIRGTEGASPAIDREAGFKEILSDYPEYNLKYSACGNFTYEGGYEVMKTYLKFQKVCDIKVLFCHNDDMALGAITAMEEAGIKPGEDIKIISVDGTGAALDALRMGKISCVVECSPLLGPQLMKAIKDLMDGKELPIRIITDEIVFTKDTPEYKFLNRKY